MELFLPFSGSSFFTGVSSIVRVDVSPGFVTVVEVDAVGLLPEAEACCCWAAVLKKSKLGGSTGVPRKQRNVRKSSVFGRMLGSNSGIGPASDPLCVRFCASLVALVGLVLKLRYADVDAAPCP